MNDNNDYWNTANREREEKLRHRSFLQRNRWMIITITSLVILVVIFASTTFFLLTTRQKPANITASAVPTPTAQSAAPNQVSTPLAPTPQPTDPPTPGLNATVTTSQPSISSITTTTKNYHFNCLDHCDDKFDITLNTITINTTNKIMAWNFTVTDNGPVCPYMRASFELDPDTGPPIKADSGTFLNDSIINTNQSVRRTAGFSSAPTQGVLYTAVLTTTCSYSTAKYETVEFSY